MINLWTAADLPGKSRCVFIFKKRDKLRGKESAFLKVERATYMKKALTKASYLPCNSSIFSVN